MEQTKEHIMAFRLAKIRTNRGEMRTNQERLEAKIEVKANTSLRKTKAEKKNKPKKMETSQEEIKPNVKMEAEIHSIRYE
jgi:hypothetical protein